MSEYSEAVVLVKPLKVDDTGLVPIVVQNKVLVLPGVDVTVERMTDGLTIIKVRGTGAEESLKKIQEFLEDK